MAEYTEILSINGREVCDTAAREAAGRKLPLPTGKAVVGQYLRVSAVDAEGNVTGVELAEAPEDGKDGVSPSLNVERYVDDYGSGVYIYATNGVDAEGNPNTHMAFIEDGKDGHTPIRGTDYWTDADKEAIINGVLAALPMAEEVVY